VNEGLLRASRLAGGLRDAAALALRRFMGEFDLQFQWPG
jgi:hypothetical protein